MTTPDTGAPPPEQPRPATPGSAGPVLPPPPLPPASSPAFPTAPGGSGYPHASNPYPQQPYAQQSPSPQHQPPVPFRQPGPQHQPQVPFAQPGMPPAPIPPGYARPIAPSPVALELQKIGTSWQVPALAVGIVLVVGFVMGGALLAMASDITAFIARGVSVVQQLLLAFGIVLGGGSVSEGSASFSGNVSIASLGTIAAIGAAVYAVARRVMRREAGPAGPIGALVVRSVIEGVPAALVALFLALFGRLGNTVLLISPPLVGVLVTVWLTVATATFIARMRYRGVSRWGRAAAIVGEPLWYSAILVGVLAVIALIVLIIGSITEGEPAAFLWLPYGINLAAYAAALGQFGQVASPFSASGPMMAWDFIGGYSALLIAITMLVLLYLSVFIGARRGRAATFTAGRVWQLPVGMFVLSIAFTYTLGAMTLGGAMSSMLNVHGSTSSSGFSLTAWIGLTFSSSLLIAAFALVVSLLAEVMPRVIYTLNPRFFSFLVGTRTAQNWVSGYAPAGGGFAGGGGTMGGGFAGGTTGAAVAGGYGAGGAAFGALAPAYAAPAQPARTQMSAQPAPMVPAPPLPPRAPMSRRAKRALIGTGVSVGIVGVLIAGAAVALAVVNASRGPEGVVKEYLALLANGDAEAATAMVPIPPGNHPLATNDVFNAEGVEHIVVGEVTSEVHDDSGIVTAEIMLGDATYTTNIQVSTGEAEFGLLKTWVIDSPLVSPVEVWAVGSPNVTIAGEEHTLTAQFGGFTGRYGMYPAIYPVSLTTDSVYLAGGEDMLVVPPGLDGYVSLKASLADTVKDEILAQVQDFVTACTEVPTNMHYDCPTKVKNTNLASLELTVQVSELAWFDDDDFGFSTDDATITIVGNPTTAVPNPQPEEIVFAVNGTFTINGDDLEIDVSHAW